jgi:hypothetical protein
LPSSSALATSMLLPPGLPHANLSRSLPLISAHRHSRHNRPGAHQCVWRLEKQYSTNCRPDDSILASVGHNNRECPASSTANKSRFLMSS